MFCLSGGFGSWQPGAGVLTHCLSSPCWPLCRTSPSGFKVASDYVSLLEFYPPFFFSFLLLHSRPLLLYFPRPWFLRSLLSIMLGLKYPDCHSPNASEGSPERRPNEAACRRLAEQTLNTCLRVLWGGLEGAHLAFSLLASKVTARIKLVFWGWGDPPSQPGKSLSQQQ